MEKKNQFGAVSDIYMAKKKFWVLIMLKSVHFIGLKWAEPTPVQKLLV